MLDQGVDGLHLEEEGAAHPVEDLAEGVTQANDHDGIDAICFQGNRGVDLARGHAEGFGDDLLEQGSAFLAQDLVADIAEAGR